MGDTLFSTLGDQRVTSVLQGEILQMLAVRGSLPQHQALIYAGDISGSGTDTLKFPQIGMMGYDLMATIAEGASGVTTDITDASTTLTPTRRFKAYAASDLAKWTDPASGAINPAMFAADAVATFANQQLYDLSQMGGGFSSSVGSSGVDLGVADWLAGRIALEIANVPGPYLMVAHGRQLGDLAVAMASVAGVIQYRQDAQAVVGGIEMGTCLGVDFVKSNHVPTANAGADRAGFMFGRGAIVWGMAGVRAETADQVQLTPFILFERMRDGMAGITKYITQCYLAFAEAIDAAGVGVVTDA